MSSPIQQRKDHHLDLCATDEVSFKKTTTLLEDVKLVHQSLPDLHVDEIDTSVTLLGKRLRWPIVIAAMTGGTDRAGKVNRDLATIAEERGYGFGLGSQRAMQRQPDTAWTYQVREWAPSTLILGNVGVVQARDWDTAQIAKMVTDIGADALCLHMNPAQETVQPGGDRDFRGGFETFKRLTAELPVPVVGKETGCGISYQTAKRLYQAGVRTVDVSGAGGTSWVAVEALRAEGDQAALGRALWDWGVPTAAAVHLNVAVGMEAIATGGIRDGMDVVKCLALGASASGIARMMLQAHVEGGRDAVIAQCERIEQEIRSVMLLCGAAKIADLRKVPRLIRGELRDWMAMAD